MYRQEKKIENYLFRQVKSIGGWAFKFVSPGLSGVPDRLVLKDGRAVFVELKAPGVGPDKRQKCIHSRIRDLGFEVYVIDSQEQVGELIEKLRR